MRVLTPEDAKKMTLEEKKDFAQKYLLDFAKKSEANQTFVLTIVNQYLLAPSIEVFMEAHLGETSEEIAHAIVVMGL